MLARGKPDLNKEELAKVIEIALTPEQLATINAQLDEFVRRPTASAIGSASGSPAPARKRAMCTQQPAIYPDLEITL